MLASQIQGRMMRCLFCGVFNIKRQQLRRYPGGFRLCGFSLSTVPLCVGRTITRNYFGSALA